MAELVGGALLSAAFQSMFDNLNRQEVVDFLVGKNLISKPIEKLKIKLLSVDQVLDDAEYKQLANQRVRQWLGKLQEAVYEADDIIYEIESEARQREIMRPEPGCSMMIKVPKNFISPRVVEKKMASKLVKILEKLEFIVSQKDDLGLVPNVESRPLLVSPVAPLLEEPDVYGRNDDKEAILKSLLSDGVSDSNIEVISIVGLGGVGKTTLARLIFNEGRVEQHFDLKVWVTVSDVFDEFQIAKSIFKKASPQAGDMDDKDELRVQLKEALKEKKFLFILDDIWNEDYMKWRALNSLFELGKRGSKIIATTRSEKIAAIMGSVSTQLIGILSDEDSWKLFAKHAFRGGAARFEDIGRMIVKKCNGLPLALTSLGGLLCSEFNVEAWEKILDDRIWELSIEKCGILPALWLSYYHLPQHLKRCFAYCSIFPKDYSIRTEELIGLWMAEGFLQASGGQWRKDVGEEYVRALLSRSLFQPGLFFENVPIFDITMHDLVHDLATFVAGNFFSFLDDNSNLDGRTRYVAITPFQDKAIKKFQQLVLPKASCVRTFLSLGPLGRVVNLPNDILLLPNIPRRQSVRVLSLAGCKISGLPQSVLNFKFLRCLNLCGAIFKEVPSTIGNLFNLETLLLEWCDKLTSLPDSISNLKLLRVLKLSFSGIEKIPNTVCALCNLEELWLRGCRNVTHLPASLSMLVNLRILDTWGTGIQEMPPHMGNMKFLRHLSYFCLSEGTASSIKELGKLHELRGELEISGLQHVDVEDAEKSNLKDKMHLISLELLWDGDNVNDSQRGREVLDSLRPNANLKELYVRGFIGERFPDWVGDHSFRSITCVSLWRCRNCLTLPPLGQLPSLEDLWITDCESVVAIGAEFFGNGSPMNQLFRSLKTLFFAGMKKWENWSIVGAEEGAVVFPLLEKLKLVHCPKLSVALPSGCLPSLKELHVRRCEQLKRLVPIPRFKSSNISNSTKLEFIRISGCDEFLKRHVDWNLQGLTSLRPLSIEISENLFSSFPEEGQLPVTLTSLTLKRLKNLKSLNGKALQCLTSLQKLDISYCAELESLPEEGLPNSLLELSISGCPIVRERCRRNGEDYPKIAAIPKLGIWLR